MMQNTCLRPAIREELVTINAIIEAAVMNWRLPERIKRLALPIYRYTDVDFENLQIIVAEIVGNGLVGVAACEISDSEVHGQQALLLHGLYVRPEFQHQGIGSQLFSAIEALVPKYKCDGLVVRAHTDAVGFFEFHNMQRFESAEPKNDYAHRFWKSVSMIQRTSA